MNHREFQERINECADEIGGDGETIGSHGIRGWVFVFGPDGELYPVRGVRMGQMMGCGCPCDIVIDVDYTEDC